MEKKILLSKDGNDYTLKSNDDVIVCIKNLKINSEEIYQKFYSDIPLNENCINICLEKDFDDKNGNIIFGQIKSLFENIDKAINDALSGVN